MKSIFKVLARFEYIFENNCVDLIILIFFIHNFHLFKMKKFILFFALFCAFFANDAQAQTVTVNFENPYRSVAAANASISGTHNFKNGQTMSWTINYNKDEKKLRTISFVRPNFIPFEAFNAEIQAMTAGEFGAGLMDCMLSHFSTFILCASELIGQATNDCALSGGEGSGSPDCWMND